MAFSVFQKQPADTSNIIQMLALQHYIRSSISILIIMYLNIHLNMEFKNKIQCKIKIELQHTLVSTNLLNSYMHDYFKRIQCQYYRSCTRIENPMLGHHIKEKVLGTKHSMHLFQAFIRFTIFSFPFLKEGVKFGSNVPNLNEKIMPINAKCLGSSAHIVKLLHA